MGVVYGVRRVWSDVDEIWGRIVRDVNKTGERRVCEWWEREGMKTRDKERVVLVVTASSIRIRGAVSVDVISTISSVINV